MNKISRNPGKAALALFSFTAGVLLWGRQWKVLGSSLMVGGAVTGAYILCSQSEKKKVEKKAVEELPTEDSNKVDKSKEVAKEAAKKIKLFLDPFQEYPYQKYLKDTDVKNYYDKVLEPQLKKGLEVGELLKALTPEIYNHKWARTFIECLVREKIFYAHSNWLSKKGFADPANAVQTALFCCYCYRYGWECKEPISLEAFLLLSTFEGKESLKVHTEVEEGAEEATLASLKRGAKMLRPFWKNEEYKQGWMKKVGWRPWVDLARAYLVHKKGDLTGWEGAAEAAKAYSYMTKRVMTAEQKVVFILFSRGAKSYESVRNDLKYCSQDDLGDLYDFLNEEEKEVVGTELDD